MIERSLEYLKEHRDGLKHELAVHRENDITLMDGWDSIEEAYISQIEYYQKQIDELEADDVRD